MIQVDRLADVPLAEILGREVDHAALARMALSADRLNSLPSVGPKPRWSFAKQSTPRLPAVSGRRGAFNTGLIAWQGPDDWLEFDLDVWFAGEQLLLVATDVGVACMCPTNHNMHYVERVEWLVGTDEALVEAIEAAVNQIVKWFRDPGDAERWRARAGLPLNCS